MYLCRGCARMCVSNIRCNGIYYRLGRWIIHEDIQWIFVADIVWDTPKNSSKNNNNDK